MMIKTESPSCTHFRKSAAIVGERHNVGTDRRDVGCNI